MGTEASATPDTVEAVSKENDVKDFQSPPLFHPVLPQTCKYIVESNTSLDILLIKRELQLIAIELDLFQVNSSS